jgi:BarA-like signal transduction histidine kinase
MQSQNKKHWSSFAIWICLLFSWIAGCTVESQASVAVTPEIKVTPSETASPTTTPLPSLTFTPSPVPIVLPAITMSPQEAEKALQELLKTNGNCMGKCLAGIRPDEMTIQEAVDQMARWGMLWMSKGNDGGIGIHTAYLDPNSKQVNLNLDIVLRKKSEATYSVSFHIPRYEDGDFLATDVWLANRETWKAFQFRNLLKAYGIPSFVGFSMQTNENSIVYTLMMNYEQLNLEIGIGALARRNGKNVFICPSKDPHNLGIDINPDLLGVPLEKNIQISLITWQALTDSDLQSFYQTFTDENHPDQCITTTLEKIRELDPYFQ